MEYSATTSFDGIRNYLLYPSKITNNPIKTVLNTAAGIETYSYIPGYAMYWDMQGRVRASSKSIGIERKVQEI